jgi:tripartite-type tricarboxylate transporter receptor subunit TctC
VTIVVPQAVGGSSDALSRMLSDRLAAALRQPVIVDNRPGAGGTIGWEAVAKSAPDGHTLAITGSTQLISAHLYKKLSYDTFRDFTHITMVASGPYVLVVSPQKLAAGSVRELIAQARAQPGRIDFASSGNGSSQHLVGALFNAMAGVELNHVPYKGSGPAMQDLLAAQIGVSFAGVPNVLGHVRAGKLKALAVTTARRWSELPEVPTLSEAGVPGYDATLWLSISGPAGLPAPIVQRLQAEIGKALLDAELQASFRAAGVEAVAMVQPELAGYMRAEYEKWGRVVRETGATVN